MKFDTTNAGTWFWFGDEEANGGVCLRICTGDDIRDIEKITTKTKITYKQGNRHEFKVVNEKLYDELLWDFCIVNWKKVSIDGTEDVECDKEQKLLLMNRSIAFTSFVGGCMEKLSEAELVADEAEEKNLPSSQTG